MTEANTNLTATEAPLEQTPAVLTSDELSSPTIPTEHEQPIPQPAGTPLMTEGLLPAVAEAPSEEAMALDHDLRDRNTGQTDLPKTDDDGKTLVGVTLLPEAYALPVIDADESAEPFEGHPHFIRAFARDGKTYRVVHKDGGLAAQEIKQA